jgi:hypothetical protein
MNVALALAVPLAGLAFLTTGAWPGRLTIAAIVSLGVLWLTVTAAVNTDTLPRRGVVNARGVAYKTLPRVVTRTYPAYVNVSRPATRWRWTDVLLAPVEALALAWSVPVLILLLMAPIGLVLAGVLWVGRLVLRP